jgi:hypothetical protein
MQMAMRHPQAAKAKTTPPHKKRQHLGIFSLKTASFVKIGLLQAASLG